MSFEKNLKQLGIDVIEKVEDNTAIKLAKNVATILRDSFPECDINYLEFCKILLNTPMYYANMTTEISKVNYFYQNSSMYFSSKADLHNIDEYIMHECIHKIQERRNKKGNVVRIGICEFNELTVRYTALNEACVQYVTSKALRQKKELLEVYNITLLANQNYYPLITNLIEQIACLIGDKQLIDSTINANEEFKIEIIDNFGEAEFNSIWKNFDKILKIKNEILELKKSAENTEKINENIEKIQKIYIETQNKIFNSYFNNMLKMVNRENEILELLDKLSKYKNLVGKTDGYIEFDVFFENVTKIAKIKLGEIRKNASLVPLNNNVFWKIFRKIKSLFINIQNEYNK